MTPWTKEEPLGLRHGFEAPHVCLTTARGLMRDFGPVVGIARHVMDGRHDDTMRGAVPDRVAMQLSGHKTRSVFERYNIVSAGDLRTAAAQLNGLTGTKQGQSGTISGSSESESSKIAK